MISWPTPWFALLNFSRPVISATSPDPSPISSPLRLPDKLVARSVDSTEMYWIGGVFFQFLPQAQNVGIDRARGRIIGVAPHFIQQFGARDYPLLVVEKETQHLELLRSERNRLAITAQLHLGEVHFHIIEAKNIGLVRSLVQPAHGGAHPDR